MIMKNSSPLVSVILPTFNRSEYIEKAIKSVLTQTYKNIELIIVNDGSDDATSVVVSRYKEDARIKELLHKRNLGLARSLNGGIWVAGGKYIARIDDDDFWHDLEKLEKQVLFLEENRDYIIAGGGIIKIGKDGDEIERHLFPERDEDIRKMLLKTNPFVHASVMFRKELWEMVGGYDESLDYCQDWDLWMKFGSLGKYYNFQDFFLTYLQAGQNRTARNIRYCHIISSRIRKRHRNKFPGFRSAYAAGWGTYIFYLLPFNRQFHPLFSGLRKKFFNWY